MVRRTRGGAAILALALALAATACLEEGDGDGDGDGVGGSVSILGAYTDEDGNLRDMLSDFSAESGINVEYEGSADFETVAVSRMEGGNPPDILIFPQPGLMADFAARDQLQPLDDLFDRGELEGRLHEGLIDLGLVDDQLYAIPIWLSIKSLVWYPKQAFDDAGYEAPETLTELQELTDQIREDGTTPWCIGIEASGSTGWPATDWLEDILLRTAGPEAYDQWVDGELEFASPEVTEAAEYFEEIALTDGNVLGGSTGIVTTPFGSAPEPMFEDPPACFLHKQASFIVGSFPEEAEFGTDFDVFYFPSAPEIGDYDGQPLMGAGDIAALASDNEAAREVLEYLTQPEAFEQSRAQDGGTLFAFQDFTSDQYPDPVDQAQATFLEEAEEFRFDGSDLMPGTVGSGTFWSEMVAWLNGEKDLQSALSAIDASWPEDGEEDRIDELEEEIGEEGEEEQQEEEDAGGGEDAEDES
ncbi:ABC transporter substrate-binding protein [Nitriliruptor alkaliphilus]|uniref:ABC transporter substrate-binding protein n=1 Tax=Nitriliruptor alkaliphilus TaxID=427918 RepID=UPI000AD2F8A4|nr:ABC transporter substrate-binding protein [Nitriliruptor alkaliphilus]